MYIHAQISIATYEPLSCWFHHLSSAEKGDLIFHAGVPAVGPSLRLLRPMYRGIFFLEYREGQIERYYTGSRQYHLLLRTITKTTSQHWSFSLGIPRTYLGPTTATWYRCLAVYTLPQNATRAIISGCQRCRLLLSHPISWTRTLLAALSETACNKFSHPSTSANMEVKLDITLLQVWPY